MTLFRCDACGTSLLYGACKTKTGAREFCGPDRSPCHRTGLASARWAATFTPVDAAALLAADVSAQQEQEPRAA